MTKHFHINYKQQDKGFQPNHCRLKHNPHIATPGLHIPTPKSQTQQPQSIDHHNHTHSRAHWFKHSCTNAGGVDITLSVIESEPTLGPW